MQSITGQIMTGKNKREKNEHFSKEFCRTFRFRYWKFLTQASAFTINKYFQNASK